MKVTRDFRMTNEQSEEYWAGFLAGARSEEIERACYHGEFLIGYSDGKLAMNFFNYARERATYTGHRGSKTDKRTLHELLQLDQSPHPMIDC